MDYDYYLETRHDTGFDPGIYRPNLMIVFQSRRWLTQPNPTQAAKNLTDQTWNKKVGP